MLLYAKKYFFCCCRSYLLNIRNYCCVDLGSYRKTTFRPNEEINNCIHSAILASILTYLYKVVICVLMSVYLEDLENEVSKLLQNQTTTLRTSSRSIYLCFISLGLKHSTLRTFTGFIFQPHKM